jgi:hypothetical protein
MIVTSVNSMSTFDPSSQIKPAASKKDALSSSAGVQPPAQAARSAPPAVVQPVANKSSLSGDKIFDRRDANQDGTLSYQETLQADREKPASTPAQAASSAAYNQMGKAAAPTSSLPQSSFNLFA